MSSNTARKVQKLFKQLDSVLRNGDDLSPETLRRMVEIAQASHEYVREQASQMEDNVEMIERQERKLELLDREKTLIRRQVKQYQLELSDLHQAREDCRTKLKAESKVLADFQSANNKERKKLKSLHKETAAAYDTLRQLQYYQHDVCRRIHKYQAIHDEWQATCEAKDSATEGRQTHQATLQVVEGPRVPDCINKVASVSPQVLGSIQNVAPGSLEVSSSTEGAVKGCLDNSNSHCQADNDVEAILDMLLGSVECSDSAECAAVDSLAVIGSIFEVAVDDLEASTITEPIAVEHKAKQSFDVTCSTEIIVVECSEFSSNNEDAPTIASGSSVLSLAAAADLYADDVDAAVGSCCKDAGNTIDTSVHCMAQLASSKHGKLQLSSWSFKALAAKAKTACKKLLVSSSKNMNARDGRRNSGSHGSSRRISLFDWGSRIGSGRASLVQ